ncbi:hypothetical protein AM231_05595 [Paenibacillus solani]|uniref:Uncharacterized protein n=1 Tax=Paenibacillus solani TaxID=1705565 RepID=A0A0M1P2H8_9BACL|nr:hypothetical protein AM231_05595 [Paenibacillus solani]
MKSRSNLDLQKLNNLLKAAPSIGTAFYSIEATLSRPELTEEKYDSIRVESGGFSHTNGNLAVKECFG